MGLITPCDRDSCFVGNLCEECDTPTNTPNAALADELGQCWNTYVGSGCDAVEYVCVKPKPYLNAPAFVFGNIAVKERVHSMHFNVGPYDIPDRFEPFHGFLHPGDCRRIGKVP